ncbi:hypothetical protein ACFLTH_04385 [Bacteroidota bacterium]
MNDIDKQLYDALKEFSRSKKKSFEKIQHIITQSMINTLFLSNYVDEGTLLITTKGLEELRKLESIKLSEREQWRANLAIGISILSIIIAVLVFIYG